MCMGNGVVPNDPGIHPDGSSDVIARLLLIAWPGYKQRDITKGPRGPEDAARWKDKSPGGCTNRVCPITDPVLLEETT